MRNKIDYPLTRRLIAQYQQQDSSREHTFELPRLTHPDIIDYRKPSGLTVDTAELKKTLSSYLPSQQADAIYRSVAGTPTTSRKPAAPSPKKSKSGSGGKTTLSTRDMEYIGRRLVPYLAFGLLNGGSATSYFDHHRNQEFSTELFKHFTVPFDRAKHHFDHLPKGLAPAVYNCDGSAGPTFLEIKIRHLQRIYGELRAEDIDFPNGAHIPLFQMTSNSTHQAIRSETARLRKRFLELRVPGGMGKPPRWQYPLIAQQTLVGALAADLPPDNSGARPQYFSYKDNRRTRRLGLPAGHGQSFHVLRAIYQKLLDRGYRFATLGNIDNIAYCIDPELIAHVALADIDGAFIFLPRSSVDVKGGVLVKQEDERLTFLTLGAPGTTPALRRQLDKKESDVFFCAAVGIFNLRRLIEQLDTIIATLPVLLLNKKTDRGAYWQLEQQAWDVMPLMENSKVFLLPKARGLLAAKLLLESYLTSGLPMPANSEFAEIGTHLFSSAQQILSSSIGLEYHNGFWL